MNATDFEVIVSFLIVIISYILPLLITMLTFSIIFIFALFIMVINVVITGIPLYTMAKNAGFKKPFYAYIPFLSTYLMAILPKKDFNIWNFIVIKERKKASIISTFVINSSIILLILCAIPFVSLLVMPIFSMISPILGIAIYIFQWKIYYDLFVTYRMGENALLFSILSLFVPLMGIIMLFVIMNNEPDYGYNNFDVDYKNEVAL